MPNISRKQIEALEKFIMCTPKSDDANKALVMLQGLLDQPEAEPVVYQWKSVFTNNKWRDVSKEEHDLVAQTDAVTLGQSKVRKLYTHPPAPRKITAEDITSEMHTEWNKVFTEGNPMCCPKDGAVMAAAYNAVNAYLTLEKL